MTKFSVIVPIYNVEKYIGELIESIQNQSLTDIEIILVDDGSPDNSGKICDQYANKDNRIKVIHKKNAGVSAARNDGLKEAQGEYVIFCDSDDWLPLDALESLYNEAKSKDADIVIGDVYKSFSDGRNVRTYFYAHDFVTEDRNFIDKMIQADFYKTYCPLPYKTGPAFGYGGPWNKAVKRQLLLDNGIKFDERVKGIYDDILYTAHILANAKKIAYIQVPVYYYRMLPNSITKTFKANALDINDAIFTAWKEFINKYDSNNMFKEPYYVNVVRRLLETCNIYYFSDKNPRKGTRAIKDLKEKIKEEPYKTAIKSAPTNRMSGITKIYLSLLKRNMVYSLYILYKSKNLAKKILK